jgi:O-antigen/teichoic acid export membrane protein
MKISDPIISQSWKNNDLEHLKFLYKKTSMSQLVIGALLFIGIWGNESNIFRILPETYEQGKYVILFIGLAFLSDMACGASSLILANSRYFKYQAFFMFLLILLVVVTNLLFIPIWGMTGAAIATLLSKLLTNLGIFLFLKIKFNLQPYSWKYFSIFIFAAIAYLAGYFLPESSNLYLDIMYRSAVIAVVYLTLLLRFRIFTELNEKFTWVLHKSGFLSEKKGPR